MSDPEHFDTFNDGSGARRTPRSRGARSPFIWFLNLVVSGLFFAGVLFAFLFWYGAERFDAPGPLAEPTTFTVPSGASFSSIAPKLAEANIIEDPGPLRIFTRGVRAAGRDRDLKAGEFAFSPGMSMRQVMEELVDGRAIEYSLTFPEGWTSYQMVERIRSADTLTGELGEMPAEGTLKPDTYTFPRGFDRQTLVERMRSAQSAALEAAWADRDPDLPLSSPEEMLTLASIVEKETGVPEERPQVAAVFVNRLKKGIRLQTDPTIIYGIWGGQGKPKDRGGLRRSEIDRKTEYNTYQSDGLPPGPIANPGEKSLRAVANPADITSIYFVADGTGGHAFADTLQEHNSNVAKWRKIEQQMRDAEAAAGDDEQPSGTTTGDGADN